MHRDWTYVDDVVQAVASAVDRRLGYEAINIGRGKPVLLSEFVQWIEELAGRKANLEPASMPGTDIPYNFPTGTRDEETCCHRRIFLPLRLRIKAEFEISSSWEDVGHRNL